MNKYALLSLGAIALASPAFAAQTISVPDVAPAAAGYQVVINIPQQRLFLFKDGSLKKVYPVGVGKAMSQTNIGEHKIGAKAFNPTWHIPLSIQKERGDGVKSVPPGPKNPLGPVFVRLGNPKLGLGIHGTSNPASVPVGRYSKAALEKAGIWDNIRSKVITTQNVRQSLDYVARGEVDAGFVYNTDAMLMKDKVKVLKTVPTQEPVSYPIAVAASGPQKVEAKRFVQYVLSAQGQGVLNKYGFKKP